MGGGERVFETSKLCLVCKVCGSMGCTFKLVTPVNVCKELFFVLFLFLLYCCSITAVCIFSNVCKVLNIIIKTSHFSLIIRHNL